MSEQSSSSPRALFEYHQDYPLLISGAHRKPSIPVSTPALAWHCAFWIPDDKIGKRIKGNVWNSQRHLWVEDIERFVLGIYDNLVEHGNDGEKITPSWQKSGNNPPRLYVLRHSYLVDPASRKEQAPITIGNYPTRFPTILFTFPWQSMPVKIGLELHTEYFALSSIIDLSGWTLKGTGDGNPRPAAEQLHDAISQFNSVTKNRFGNLDKPEALRTVADDRNDLKDTYNVLYHEVWQQFYDEILAKPFSDVGKIDKQNALHGATRLGQAFTDFRGFIASRGDDSNFISLPGAAPITELTKPGRVFALDEDVNCVNTVLPFMTVGDEGEVREHTYSRFLHGRALYATALGAQPPEPEAQAQPLTYLFLFTHHDPWQIGRLVERKDTLGDLRLAAVFGLQHIVEAEHRLRELEQDLEEVASGMADRLRGRDAEQEIQHFSERLGDISTALAKIGQNEVTKERVVAGGIRSRMQRAKTFRGLFLDHIPALREERIEGFQPYSQFVARRLNRTHALIDTTFESYNRVATTVTDLSQQLRTIQTVGHQREIRTIQTLGEAAVFIAIVPEAASKLTMDYIGEETLKSHPDYNSLISIKSVVVSFVAWIGYKAFRQYYESRARDRTADQDASLPKRLSSVVRQSVRNIINPPTNS